MSWNGEEQPQVGSTAGQNSPRTSLFLMLLSGFLLVALLFIPSDGKWWLPAASDRDKMFALIFAGMVLANNLLKSHDLNRFDKEFPTIVIALMAWGTVFLTTVAEGDGNLGSSVFTLLATIPVLVAIAGPRLSQIKQVRRQILAFVSGLVLYLGAFLVAAILSIALENVGIFWQVTIGVIGISGAAIAVGVSVGIAGQLLGSGKRAFSRFRKGKK